ncbi:hypothetical protein GJ744_002705 [Endocarpon pusillum]|uniref:Uncharacterized protein n=1 Tax=Endocarpon pusillum TaxID=364733 RepID=A0A8H7E7C4_9EURO|nr:hypothetical protein GJ744_002705 [Endocarpon pusillum]
MQVTGHQTEDNQTQPTVSSQTLRILALRPHIPHPSRSNPADDLVHSIPNPGKLTSPLVTPPHSAPILASLSFLLLFQPSGSSFSPFDFLTSNHPRNSQ